LLAYGAYRAARPDSETEFRTSLSVAEVLGAGSEEGFARALEPRPFRFPDDHGPHPDFRTEWWYITGNLDGPGGEPFGFQFTIFRNALNPLPRESASAWASDQVYMAHLAVTDGEGQTFRAFERFSREALGLAGARAQPFRVWLEDWTLEGLEDSGLFPLRVVALEEGVGVELELEALKPLVLQGEDGLSQKGPEPGNASYYYSHTRLEASGRVWMDGEPTPVTGLAWLDREWSTSVLSQGQVGWDWFALQLSDGWDLMYYQLRLQDGTPDPLSKGVIVSPLGEGRVLTTGEVRLTALGRWRSPLDGAEYPSGWRLEIPRRSIDLEIRPLIPDQELQVAFRYWEGAVLVQGRGVDGPVQGRGYVELTGYAGPDENATLNPKAGSPDPGPSGTGG
jgi:predicted secreted hydrolase